MTFLDEGVLANLRQLTEEPDLGGTRYRLAERLGRGGMGTVYRVEDAELHRSVALKVLHDPLPEAAATERLRQEARVLARLEHPGIVPVHDVGTLADGRTYYTMKLVEGQRLDEIAAEDPPLPTLLRIFERICEAVAFAHAHGVVHRDLKPENVMVGSFGEVLVMDWGVARVRILEPAPQGVPESPHPEQPREAANPEPTGKETLQGTVLGTPGYMAPEQARGDVAAVDHRADVYALGAILLFLLTGEPPEETPRRQAEEAQPKGLAAVARRALAVRPEERYQDAAELGREVARYLAGDAVRAHRETVFDRLKRTVYRYRTPILLVLAYLLMRAVLFLVAGF